MASSDLWNAPDIVPALTYSDSPRAVEWFERVFGFRERAEARLSWPGGSLTWIEVGSKEQGSFPSQRTDSGAAGSIARWTTRGVAGRFRSAVAISRPRAGNCLLA